MNRLKSIKTSKNKPTRFRRIHGTYLTLVKRNWKIAICNRLDLKTPWSHLNRLCPKISPNIGWMCLHAWVTPRTNSHGVPSMKCIGCLHGKTFWRWSLGFVLRVGSSKKPCPTLNTSPHGYFHRTIKIQLQLQYWPFSNGGLRLKNWDFASMVGGVAIRKWDLGHWP